MSFDDQTCIVWRQMDLIGSHINLLVDALTRLITTVSVLPLNACSHASHPGVQSLPILAAFIVC